LRHSVETVDLRWTAISPAVKLFKHWCPAHCYGCIRGSWIRICGTTRTRGV